MNNKNKSESIDEIQNIEMKEKIVYSVEDVIDEKLEQTPRAGLKPLLERVDLELINRLAAELETATPTDDDNEWLEEENEKWRKERYAFINAMTDKDHMGIGYIINNRIIQYDIADFLSLWVESIIGRSTFDDMTDFFDSKEMLSLQILYPNIEEFRELFRGISVGGLKDMLDKLCLGEYGTPNKSEIDLRFSELNGILKGSGFKVGYTFLEKQTYFSRVDEFEY